MNLLENDVEATDEGVLMGWCNHLLGTSINILVIILEFEWLLAISFLDEIAIFDY